MWSTRLASTFLGLSSRLQVFQLSRRDRADPSGRVQMVSLAEMPSILRGTGVFRPTQV